MRCAHCGHSLRYRNLFRFRADGGHRCESCREVFYLDPALARKHLRPINLLLVAIFVGGFMLILGNELMTVWLMPLYLAAFFPIFAAAYYFALNDIPTIQSLPPRVLWRRRCFNYGIFFWAIGQGLAFLSKPYVPADDWSHYFSITGTSIFILFAIAGYASPPKRLSPPESN